MLKIAIGIFLLASTLHADDYSDRARQIENQRMNEINQAEMARTQTDNAHMISAAHAVAAYTGGSVDPSTLKCPVRTEVYWEGFSNYAGDPWYSVRYQYCKFNTIPQNDACEIGMTFGTPVYVSCIDTHQAQRSYTVSAGGQVSVSSDRGSVAHPRRGPRKRRSH